jgi:hypothetical protein
LEKLMPKVVARSSFSRQCAQEFDFTILSIGGFPQASEFELGHREISVFAPAKNFGELSEATG